MMTEEELSKIRSNWNTIAGRTFGIIDNFAINRECAESLQAVPKLLAHIDDQANQIAKLTEETDCTEIYESLESAGIDMGDNEQPQDIVTAIEILVSQIATLKAALISERNRYLVDFIHEYDDVRDCKEEAKEQLAKEYPEIDWEE